MLSIRLIIQILFIVSVINTSKVREFKNSKLLMNDDKLQLVHDSDDLSFFVIGDWGGLPNSPYRTLIESQVSDSMTKIGQTHDTKFQVALGDNFYFDGVKDVDDKRFKETFEDVFNSEHLVNTPWFVVLGNHDHYGNASAQLSYSEQSKRWIFPNFNYTIGIGPRPGKVQVMILFIDTILMCGNTGHDFVHTQPIFENTKSMQKSNDYFEALENELKNINEHQPVDYLFVAGHFPVWSIAEHGPTKCLVDKLRPLLHKYKVSGYLSGHDHNLQHIAETYMDTKVDYILSGAANFIDNSTSHINDIPKDSLKFHYGDASGVVNGGFCLFKATNDNLTVTYFESTGLELYQTYIYPRN